MFSVSSKRITVNRSNKYNTIKISTSFDYYNFDQSLDKDNLNKTVKRCLITKSEKLEKWKKNVFADSLSLSFFLLKFKCIRFKRIEKQAKVIKKSSNTKAEITQMKDTRFFRLKYKHDMKYAEIKITERHLTRRDKTWTNKRAKKTSHL